MEELFALAARVGQRLTDRGETIAVAESSSGGLLSAALLSMPGASKYYKGGGVVYTAIAREQIMGLGRDDVKGMRSSSEPYAELLARTAQSRFGATWGISETGAAGPTGNGYGDAPGHSCIAIYGPAAKVMTLETGMGDRAKNMVMFAMAALEFLLEELK